MLQISPEDPFSSTATSLITELSDDLAERYDESDGAGNFAPADATVPRSIFVVAWFGGEAVGCGAIRPFDERTAEVKRMFVQPGERGKGIGREILLELERYARSFGYTRLCLETGVRQPEAIALYEKAGFRRIPRYEPHVDDVRSVCFAKEIPANAGKKPAA